MNSNGKTRQVTDFSSTQTVNNHFEHLQTQLESLQQAINFRPEHQHTFVIIPSFIIYSQHPWAEYQAHEERLLFFLGLLRQENTRVIYITSSPISAAVKTYSLNVMAPKYNDKQKRLFFITINDERPTLSLTEKLLAHSKHLDTIKKHISNTKLCHIIPYQMTTHEQTLALKLNIPIYGCQPKLLAFASKSSSRKLFKALGIQPPFGYEDIQDKTALIAAIKKIHIQQPNTKKIIIKWNRGVSGQGNAVVDLTQLLKSDNSPNDILIKDLLDHAELVNRRLTREDYFVKFSRNGGIIETYIADLHTSPSVQLEILPDKTIKILSTTEQIMGGIAAQHFTGCQFPASDATSGAIQAKTIIIARTLAAKGVIGFLNVDFVITHQNKMIKNCYPIEINLRLSGAINPLLMLQFLTNGQYYPEKNAFLTKDGNTKCFIEHDDLSLPKQQSITPQQLYDKIQAHELQFSETKQTGIIVHMISALETSNKYGLVAIGNSSKQAEQIAQKAVSVVSHR